MHVENELFQEAAGSWNLEKLYLDLTQVKRIITNKEAQLSPIEKAILRGLLCYCSPKQIATELHWAYGSLATELTRGLYRYVETLTAREANTLKNWRDIAQWLEEAGYKTAKEKRDWEEAPDLASFYGRKAELTQLEQWIVRDKYRLVMLLGMAGIGKTVLAVKLAQKIQYEFEYIIWRTLRHAPLLNELVESLLNFLIKGKTTELPTTINGKISLLMQYLRLSRCLLVLDGLETIVGSNNLNGFYQEPYRNYSQLLKRIAEEPHQSCLLLTSQDEPADMLLLAGNKVESLQLGSLGEAARGILTEKGLSGGREWQYLIDRYQGNPLALKLVSATIKELFAGNVSSFLKTDTYLGVIIPTVFKELLSEQFERLSVLEKQIMYCLAINRHPVTIEKLQEYLKPKVYISDLTQALTSLKRRSLLEISSLLNQTSFTLHPIMIKYVLREHRHECEQLRKNQIA
jgi:hypothetical protein